MPLIKKKYFKSKSYIEYNNRDLRVTSASVNTNDKKPYRITCKLNSSDNNINGKYSRNPDGEAVKFNKHLSEDDRIVCRHLTAAWLKEEFALSETMNESTMFRHIAVPTVEVHRKYEDKFQRDLDLHTHRRDYCQADYVPTLMKKILMDMKSKDIDYCKYNFTTYSGRADSAGHSMGIKFYLKKDSNNPEKCYYEVHFYDPNNTDNEIIMLGTDIEKLDVKNDFSDFKNIIAKYTQSNTLCCLNRMGKSRRFGEDITVKLHKINEAQQAECNEDTLNAAVGTITYGHLPEGYPLKEKLYTHILKPNISIGRKLKIIEKANHIVIDRSGSQITWKGLSALFKVNPDSFFEVFVDSLQAEPPIVDKKVISSYANALFKSIQDDKNLQDSEKYARLREIIIALDKSALPDDIKMLFLEPVLKDKNMVDNISESILQICINIEIKANGKDSIFLKVTDRQSQNPLSRFASSVLSSNM